MKRSIALLIVLASPALAQHAHNADPDWGVKVPVDEVKVQAKLWKDVFDQLTEIQNARVPGTRQGLQEHVGWMELNNASAARKAGNDAAFAAAIKRAEAAIARARAGQ